MKSSRLTLLFIGVALAVNAEGTATELSPGRPAICGNNAGARARCLWTAENSAFAQRFGPDDFGPAQGPASPPPAGIRRGDRPGRAWVEMNGANPMLDENLLRVFYVLTEMTGDSRYARAADEELAWFFNNAMSPKTSLLPWGEHLCWDVVLDLPISGGDENMHEFARPWVLWDRCRIRAIRCS